MESITSEVLILITLIPSVICLIVGYFVGRSRGERFVKNTFDETIADLEREREEYQVWVQNGEKINQIPVPRFGLISFDFNYDPEFELKQNMGRKIKRLKGYSDT